MPPKQRLMSIREFAAETSLTYRQVVYRIGTGQIKAEKYNWSPMIPESEATRIATEKWYRDAHKTEPATA